MNKPINKGKLSKYQYRKTIGYQSFLVMIVKKRVNKAGSLPNSGQWVPDKGLVKQTNGFEN